MLSVYLIYASSIETGDVNVFKNVYRSFTKATEDIDNMINKYIKDRNAEKISRIIPKEDFSLSVLNNDKTFLIGGYCFKKKKSSAVIYKKTLVEGRLWNSSKMILVGKIGLLSEINIPVNEKLIRLLNLISEDSSDQPDDKRVDSIDRIDNSDGCIYKPKKDNNYEHGQHVMFINELKDEIEKRRDLKFKFEIHKRRDLMNIDNDSTESSDSTESNDNSTEHNESIDSVDSVETIDSKPIDSDESTEYVDITKYVDNHTEESFESTEVDSIELIEPNKNKKSVEYDSSYLSDSSSFEYSSELSELSELYHVSELSEELDIIDSSEKAPELPEFPEYFDFSKEYENMIEREMDKTETIIYPQYVESYLEYYPEICHYVKNLKEMEINNDILDSDISDILDSSDSDIEEETTESEDSDSDIEVETEKTINIREITFELGEDYITPDWEYNPTWDNPDWEEEWEVVEYYENDINTDPMIRKYIDPELVKNISL